MCTDWWFTSFFPELKYFSQVLQSPGSLHFPYKLTNRTFCRMWNTFTKSVIVHLCVYLWTWRDLSLVQLSPVTSYQSPIIIQPKKLDGLGPVDNRPSTLSTKKIKTRWTCDTWHMTCDSCYMTRNMWHATCDTWDMTHRRRWTFSQNFAPWLLWFRS